MFHRLPLWWRARRSCAILERPNRSQKHAGLSGFGVRRSLIGEESIVTNSKLGLIIAVLSASLGAGCATSGGRLVSNCEGQAGARRQAGIASIWAALPEDSESVLVLAPEAIIGGMPSPFAALSAHLRALTDITTDELNQSALSCVRTHLSGDSKAAIAESGRRFTTPSAPGIGPYERVLIFHSTRDVAALIREIRAANTAAFTVAEVADNVIIEGSYRWPGADIASECRCVVAVIAPGTIVVAPAVRDVLRVMEREQRQPELHPWASRISSTSTPLFIGRDFRAAGDDVFFTPHCEDAIRSPSEANWLVLELDAANPFRFHGVASVPNREALMAYLSRVCFDREALRMSHVGSDQDLRFTCEFDSTRTNDAAWCITARLWFGVRIVL